MPDITVPKPTPATPEGVAFALLELISQVEKDAQYEEQRLRFYWLNLYAQCLQTVTGNRASGSPQSAPTPSDG